MDDLPSKTVKKSKKEKKEKKSKKEKKNKRKRADDSVIAEVENQKDSISLCLFYQYIEPPWNTEEHEKALKFMKESGEKFNIGGRMRVATEGINCTITGSYENVRKWTDNLVRWSPGEFGKTEFKFTDNLPMGQAFPNLKAFEVVEIVNYGLAGEKAPSIQQFGGTHLEPEDYHKKMEEEDTVIIDVRNHYEAIIGRFNPPKDGAKWIDPKMRKSTEFPVWLDKPETKEQLKGKQVLMYCTGGIRCERASALLKQKLETEGDMKELGVKGVYQLQGGIDKYFKQFSDGGHWKGKNYVFDKRFSHAPPEACVGADPLSTCEKCSKPWDKFKGKRRCPTCGVPSLICRDCFEADPKGKDRNVRCDLCVQENITHKSQIRNRQKEELAALEQKYLNLRPSKRSRVDDLDVSQYKPLAPNPERITRLFLSNLCTKNTTEDILCNLLPNITHIMWLSDRKSGAFYGKAFLEMATPEDAAFAVGQDGCRVLGRNIKIKFQKADAKDLWPPPNCRL
mmetsp:Transcript_6609/g.9663  ORF Transcript_6609/g.9663 Transcript_6609/m.9663 type:complete len:509 (-) Transcript_6609:28-1554(-)|eukprot:CAMPEP_0196814894 /NCGR_PEP_ID=MMETSP1362-20130617/46467_1 /TAXON_ID=163516 /ORGANISM="Leptocylindrus danicus, Strain CCMP1856" /LENGTH=508 /DNA_ID=CAMNT_0042191667 /DNA_START=111 /DNA_END=1637 /DNA_ORIENTATION=-